MRLKPTCSRGLPIEESSMLLRPDDASVPERVYDGVVHNRVWLAALALHCLERLHCESTTQCTQSSTCLFLMQVISAGLDVGLTSDLTPLMISRSYFPIPDGRQKCGLPSSRRWSSRHLWVTDLTVLFCNPHCKDAMRSMCMQLQSTDQLCFRSCDATPAGQAATCHRAQTLR